jgi:hypothetical protein
MNRDQTLARLVTLRRRREERAIERAIQCDGACRRAAQRVEDAREAASIHQNQSRQQEHELIGSLVGQILPTNVLHGLQATLDAAADAQDRLRTAHADAQSELREHVETRNAAQTEVRDCRRAVAKLDYLQQRAMTQEQRRRESLAEAADEDRGRRAAL